MSKQKQEKEIAIIPKVEEKTYTLNGRKLTFVGSDGGKYTVNITGFNDQAISIKQFEAIVKTEEARNLQAKNTPKIAPLQAELTKLLEKKEIAEKQIIANPEKEEFSQNLEDLNNSIDLLINEINSTDNTFGNLLGMAHGFIETIFYDFAKAYPNHWLVQEEYHPVKGLTENTLNYFKNLISPNVPIFQLMKNLSIQ